MPRKLFWSAVSPRSGGVRGDFLFKRDTCAAPPPRCCSCRRHHCWDHTTEIWERFCILSYITVDHLCDLRRRQRGAPALALADKWRSFTLADKWWADIRPDADACKSLWSSQRRGHCCVLSVDSFCCPPVGSPSLSLSCVVCRTG